MSDRSTSELRPAPTLGMDASSGLGQSFHRRQNTGFGNKVLAMTFVLMSSTAWF